MTGKTYSEFVAETTDQTLAALKEAQDFSLRATEAALSAVPGAPQIPAATEVVEASFDFVGKVLDQQRAYWLEVAELLTAPDGKTSPKPASSKS